MFGRVKFLLVGFFVLSSACGSEDGIFDDGEIRYRKIRTNVAGPTESLIVEYLHGVAESYAEFSGRDPAEVKQRIWENPPEIKMTKGPVDCDSGSNEVVKGKCRGSFSPPTSITISYEKGVDFDVPRRDDVIVIRIGPKKPDMCNTSLGHEMAHYFLYQFSGNEDSFHSQQETWEWAKSLSCR